MRPTKSMRSDGKRSRKELRKEKRHLKKVRKNEHYFKKFHKKAPTHPFVSKNETQDTGGKKSKLPKKRKLVQQGMSEVTLSAEHCDTETVYKAPQERNRTLVDRIREAERGKKERSVKRKETERKARNEQLQEANKIEDKEIKQLESLMKINKRKKGKPGQLPKYFGLDGLDYLLDATDPEKLKEISADQPILEDDEEDFESDLLLATDGPNPDRKTREKKKQDQIVTDEGQGDDHSGEGSDLGDAEGAGDSDSEAVSADGGSDVSEGPEEDSDVGGGDDANSDAEDVSADGGSDVSAGSEEDSDVGGGDDADSDGERSQSDSDAEQVAPSVSEDSGAEGDGPGPGTKRKAGGRRTDGGPTGKRGRQADSAEQGDGVWEDIYGRFRDKQGKILTGIGAGGDTSAPGGGRYVPPALRAQQMAVSGDKRAELAQLRRRLKGQLNRLAERTVRTVLALVEELYTSHSRHDTSDTLTQLVHEACVAPAALTPERLLMEHVLLIAALHANVGTEVGAHFLLKTAQRFHRQLTAESADDQNKEVDNLLLLLAHLYGFKVTDSTVIFDILRLLAERFRPKDVDLILTLLRSVGFHLRRDDPVRLRELILQLQTQAATASTEHGSRVRFMLETLLAIRNNNMTKIPQYDPQLGQDFTKLLKSLVSPSQSLTVLTISLQDLLKAEERGKWWVVGSAWTGGLKEAQPADSSAAGDQQESAGQPAAQQRFSAELLLLARQQRMNTDLRRNIFCIIMSAEDYLDAFEKLMHLGLRGSQQQQEVTSVVLECGLRERSYNPYYSHLLERICTSDRRYQMCTKISVWERLRELAGLGSGPATNLAKTLAHLISSGQLSVAVLKVVEFAEMSKPMVRFLRQLLLALLLQSEDGDQVDTVFQRAGGPRLKHLRDSLVLFLHHFVLRNKHKLGEQRTVLTLEERVRRAVTALRIADGSGLAL